MAWTSGDLGTAMQKHHHWKRARAVWKDEVDGGLEQTLLI